MTTTQTPAKVRAYHPLLFALFPVLFVYSRNIDQLTLSQIWASLAVVTGVTLFFFLSFALILRNVNSAAMVLSVLVLIFFALTPVTSLFVLRWHKIATGIGPRVVLALWGALLAVGLALAVRVRQALPDVTRVLNAASLALVIFPLLTIGYYEVRWHLLAPPDQLRSETVVTTGPAGQELPDIYFVILDGYARADVLDEIYGFDNSEFLSYLRDKGFIVAEQSRSNYAQTALSVASVLNMGYLDEQVGRFNSHSRDRGPLNKLIKGSAVFNFLRRNGYTIVAFPSGYGATSVTTADIYMGDRAALNALEMTVLANSPISWLFAALGRQPVNYEPHRDAIRHTLDHLADAVSLPGPHLVFAHVVAPHPPFVLDSQGHDVTPEREFSLSDGSDFMRSGTPEEYRHGYTEQVAYVNHQLQLAIDRILSQPSSRPVVIILQADHGPGLFLDWSDVKNTCLKERMSILNAYRLPGTGDVAPYETITPVNSFRLVFNRYFGTDLEMLDDRSYYSHWGRPYDFLDVTEQAVSGEVCPIP